MRDNLFDIGLGDEKCKKKKKNKKSDHITLKKLLLSKENHQRNEKATNLQNGRKYLQNHMADGGVRIQKYKELIQLDRKKKQLKNGQRL